MMIDLNPTISVIMLNVNNLNISIRGFPGAPVVKTSSANAGGAVSVPGRGAGMLHARTKSQHIK